MKHTGSTSPCAVCFSENKCYLCVRCFTDFKFSGMEERIQKAVALFRQGYNCAQSVCAAFADMYGYTEEQGLKMAASFGGGIGRMRMTCGAACGMFVLAGLETGCTEGGDKAGKEANYRVVQGLAEEFSRRMGSLVCAELLGLPAVSHNDPVPEARTQAYYKKRPCVKTVEEAARIWADYLKNRSVKEETGK